MTALVANIFKVWKKITTLQKVKHNHWFSEISYCLLILFWTFTLQKQKKLHYIFLLGYSLVEIRRSQSVLCPMIKTQMKQHSQISVIGGFSLDVHMCAQHAQTQCMATCGLGAVSNLCYCLLNLWTLCQPALFEWIDW